MSNIFRLKIHDGSPFCSMITIITRLLNNAPMKLRRDSITIEKTNNQETIVMKVNFNLDYVQEYFLSPHVTEHIVTFQPNSLANAKKNDAVILYQNEKTDPVVTQIISNNRTRSNGLGNFHNIIGSAQSMNMDTLEQCEKKKYKIPLDRLCDIFKHSGYNGAISTGFIFHKTGIHVVMMNTEGKSMWQTPDPYEACEDDPEVIIPKTTIEELAKLTGLFSNGMCLVTSYDGDFFKLSIPVSCYANLDIYLISKDSEDGES